jgi:hypothetical protein
LAKQDFSDSDLGFINPEADAPPTAARMPAPATQDFQNDPASVSLGPEDRQFELTADPTAYVGAELLQQEKDAGRYSLYVALGKTYTADEVWISITGTVISHIGPGPVDSYTGPNDVLHHAAQLTR